MNSSFNIEALRAWFESCDIGKQCIWILYRGTTAGKNNWIATFDKEGGSCDEAFEALLRALSQQESMNSSRKFLVKFKTSKTDPSPKTTPLEAKAQYGHQAGISGTPGVYGADMINQFQRLNSTRFDESMRGLEQRYEAQLRHFQEKNELERKIERLTEQVDNQGGASFTEKVIDRCMPLLEVLASNMGQAIAMPPPTATVGRLKGDVEEIQSQPSSTQATNPPPTMPDFNKVVVAVMKLKRVEPNAEQLLIDMAELAIQNPSLIEQLKQFMNAISSQKSPTNESK